MEKINFVAVDEIKLDGFLYKSKRETESVILSVHGMSSNCFKYREDIIANYATNYNIDYFCFNNRGSELVKYIRKDINGKSIKTLGGTSFEDVLEGYEDIVGAIKLLRNLGYQKIYIQGHSLGSTKIVYTYNRLKQENSELLPYIKSVILLSLVDIPATLKIYLRDKFINYVEVAKEKYKVNPYSMMPNESFIHPISAKTFLRYAVNNEEINFAHYGNDDKLEKLNNIEVPLFMRWGNINEMILQSTDVLIEMVNNIIINNNKNIGYINGADHGYTDKEDILAKEIIEFIRGMSLGGNIEC